MIIKSKFLKSLKKVQKLILKKELKNCHDRKKWFSQIGKYCYSIIRSNSFLVIFFTIQMEKVTKRVIDSAKDKFPLSSGIERNLTSKKDGKANDRKGWVTFTL